VARVEETSVTRRSRRFYVAALLTVFIAGCAYGMLAERRQLFPYELVRTVLHSVTGGGPGEPSPAAGRWRASRRVPAVAPLTDEQREEMSRLASIGYVTGSAPAREGAAYGVTVYDEDLAAPGLNLVVSGHGCSAALMEMDGTVVHEWSLPYEDAFPGREVDDASNGDEYWRRAMLLPDGGLIAIYEGLGVVRLDRDSRLVWAVPGGYHHDVDATGGGFAILYREPRIVPRISRRHPILEDYVSFLDADGNVLRRFSLLEAFERSDYAPLLESMHREGDVFHTNTIEVLDGSLAERSPAFRRGNLLISVLMLNTIAVVDPETETVVWALTGQWRQQHQPTVLPNGRMLLFNNLFAPEASEVIEFDPFTQEVFWRVTGTEAFPFFSETCGSNQRLENGDTLITESDNGRAFEVTPRREVVWEYVNPHRAGPDGEFVATLFDVVRIPESERPDWLE
jgi:hypothetical protein